MVQDANSHGVNDPDPDGPSLEDEPIPDESTLLGRPGVQEEVLAELARAEAEMSGAADQNQSDSTGTQV